MAHPATRPYLTIGPIGSTGRTVRVLRYYDPASPVWGHRVYAGCWDGTLDQLAARIEPGGGHGWATAVEGQCRAEYEGAISLARLRVAAWSVPLTEEERKAREGRPAGVDLRRASLDGANLYSAHCDGLTRWPSTVDQAARGVVVMP